jgi:hypothetical protein
VASSARRIPAAAFISDELQFKNNKPAQSLKLSQRQDLSGTKIGHLLAMTLGFWRRKTV